MHPFLGIPVAFAVMWVVGWITYKLVIKRVIERDLFTSLLSIFGLAVTMAQILNLIFGSDTQSIDLGYETLRFGPNTFVDVPMSKLIGVTVALLLALDVIAS